MTTKHLTVSLLGAALALGLSAPAQAGVDVLLKDATIVGTLSSWGAAAWNGAPIGRCLTENGPWGGRLQAGHDKELDFVSAGFVRKECHLTNAAGWSLGMAPVASVGLWQASGSVTGAKSTWDLAFVPMMRWGRPLSGSTRFDVEFGIGPAWLGDPEIGNRHKSSNYQFSDHVGLGLGSADGHWRVGLAYRHISNADIRTPNNGVDYKGLSLEYRP